MKLIKNNQKKVRGQGMSEYLIIVALIAVAGIAVMGLFGSSARNQVAGLANEISGGLDTDTQAANQASMDTADGAAAEANTNVGLGNYGGSQAIITAGDGTGRVGGAD